MKKELRSYIVSLLEKDERMDGRKLDEFRNPIKVELNISKNAEGSAKVTMGKTEVIVGVKIDVGEPFLDSPDRGVLITGAELLPMSSPDFESGPPDAQTTELARIVDRGIRESNFIDTKQLCIKKGEKVWMVFIDIYSINDGGNLIDAAALGAVAALKNARFPEYDEKTGKAKYGYFTNKKLPLGKDLPLTCTVFKIANKLLVDVNNEEESVIDSRLTVTTDGKNINAIQKSSDCELSIDDVDKMIDLSFKKYKELEAVLK